MYTITHKLGQGAFGIVYHLKCNNGSEFAVKVVEIGRLKGQEIDPATEARLLLKLRHEHLVRCCVSFVTGRCMYLVMEFCQHGTLKCLLNGRKKHVKESQVLTWLGQMADALRYLHVCRVIHRDLKSDNVFLDDKRRIKIGDLGIARELDYTAQKAGTFIGTFCYMSPEVLMSSTYSFETDIWSLGCCIHEVMTLRPTFADQSMMRVMENILEARIPPMPDIYCKKLQNLVLSMFNMEPSKRPDGLAILYEIYKIQGFRFITGPNTAIENVAISQVLLCQAVQNFEHDFQEIDDLKVKSTADSVNDREEKEEFVAEGETIHDGSEVQCLKSKQKSPPTSQSSYNKQVGQVALKKEVKAERVFVRDKSRDADYLPLFKEKGLQTKLIARPLPQPKLINLDKQVGQEKKRVTVKRKTKKQENFLKINKNELSVKQNYDVKQKDEAKNYDLPREGSSMSIPFRGYENRLSSSSSSLSSLLSDRTTDSSENTTGSRENLTDSKEYSVAVEKRADSGENTKDYIDRLAEESHHWLRQKFGRLRGSDDENVSLQEGQNEDDDDDDDEPSGLVTLYTLAQVARYNHRKANSGKVRIEVQFDH